MVASLWPSSLTVLSRPRSRLGLRLGERRPPGGLRGQLHHAALQRVALVTARQGRLAEATRALDEARALVLTARSATGTSYRLEALAALALARDVAIRALASARAVRERLGIPAWTAAADAAAPVLDQARATVTAEHFAACWRAGADADPFALLAAGGTLDAAAAMS